MVVVVVVIEAVVEVSIGVEVLIEEEVSIVVAMMWKAVLVRVTVVPDVAALFPALHVGIGFVAVEEYRVYTAVAS